MGALEGAGAALSIGDGGDAVVKGGEGEIYADDGGGSGALAGGGEPGGERGRSRLARGRLGERGGRALDLGELEGAARRNDARAQPVVARRGVARICVPPECRRGQWREKAR